MMQDMPSLLELEKHLTQQETTRKINEEARIENERNRINNFEQLVTKVHTDSAYDYLVLKSPDGTAWKITIDNSGAIKTAKMPE